MREVQARLLLADEGGVGDHGEGRGRPVGELEVNDLVVAQVVRALVDALPVRPRRERGADVLDVGDGLGG